MCAITTIENHCTVQQLSSCVLLLSSRYLGEEEGSKSNSESRSKALLSKLQERAKAREQRSLATKKESDIQDTRTSEQSRIGKTKRKLEQQEKEKKQVKKMRKESIREQDDVDDTPAEHTGLGTSGQARKKNKKKDQKGSVTPQEEQQHTGSCVYYACINLSGK